MPCQLSKTQGSPRSSASALPFSCTVAMSRGFLGGETWRTRQQHPATSQTTNPQKRPLLTCTFVCMWCAKDGLRSSVKKYACLLGPAVCISDIVIIGEVVPTAGASSNPGAKRPHLFTPMHHAPYHSTLVRVVSTIVIDSIWVGCAQCLH